MCCMREANSTPKLPSLQQQEVSTPYLIKAASVFDAVGKAGGLGSSTAGQIFLPHWGVSSALEVQNSASTVWTTCGKAWISSLPSAFQLVRTVVFKLAFCAWHVRVGKCARRAAIFLPRNDSGDPFLQKWSWIWLESEHLYQISGFHFGSILIILVSAWSICYATPLTMVFARANLPWNSQDFFGVLCMPHRKSKNSYLHFALHFFQWQHSVNMCELCKLCISPRVFPCIVGNCSRNSTCRRCFPYIHQWSWSDGDTPNKGAAVCWALWIL